MDKHNQVGIAINWRTRAEGWNWFEGNTGNSDYGLLNSGHAGRIRVGSSTIRPVLLVLSYY